MASRRRLDLPEDRPASFDEHGHHVALNPASVKGPWRRRRDWVYAGLIVFFLVVPWTKFHGHQTILLDLPQRKFAFFGVTFWAHDVPLIFFILGILTFGLTFVTLVWGRVWCGWACPQTVFIDGVYRRIERWVEGSHVQRMHLNAAPLSWTKFRKKTVKWLLFWFVSTHIAHSFTAYWVGADRLLGMSLSAPWEHWTPFLFVSILTGILMFDFGWFREQFCMIMCPYGRFQSVLMDEDSLAVLYDETRGEPRKGTEPEGQDHADCINCYKCVSVCPTGIDIRRGVQMECVACTACIDACDEIMENIGRPRGLIRYASEAEMSGRRARRLRAKSVLSAAIVLILIAGFAVAVTVRKSLDVEFIRAIETPYTLHTLADGSVQATNHYRIKLKNQSFDEQTVSLTLNSQVADAGVELVAPTFPLTLAGGAATEQHVFFKFPARLTHGTGSYRFALDLTAASSRDGGEPSREPVVLVGPFSKSERAPE
jgi:cytochrome c oxidase accessory protein FixG